MGREGVSVERVSFPAYESGVQTVLEEYHRSVATGLRAWLERRGEPSAIEPESYVRGELATDVTYLRETADERPLVVALDGDRVVGCVYSYELSETEAEVKRLFVREPYRGRGIGRELMETLVGYARGAGYETLRLDTAPYMDAAISLYASLGFEPYEGGASVSDVPDAVLEELEFMRLRLDGDE